MFRQLPKILLLTFSLAVALPAHAVQLIKSQSDAVEAGRIEVSFNSGLNNGYAIAHDCAKCPVRVSIDKDTRFFLRGAPIPAKLAKSLSGEAGTIIYEKGRAIRVRWDTGTLSTK